MKDIKDTININEARITWANVHDAVLNTLKKFFKFSIIEPINLIL